MSSSLGIHFELGNLTRADGSAVAALADSCVQVAVHGPGDVPMHKELPEEAAIEIVFKDAARSKEVTAEDKELQSFVRGVVQSVVRVELYPKTLIEIVVQELESDRPFLSLALNCICAALLDAGICLRTTFGAVTVAVMSSGKVVSHFSDHHITNSTSLVTTVFDSCSKQLIAFRVQGRPVSRDQIKDCLIESESGCHQVLHNFISSLTK